MMGLKPAEIDVVFAYHSPDEVLSFEQHLDNSIWILTSRVPQFFSIGQDYSQWAGWAIRTIEFLPLHVAITTTNNVLCCGSIYHQNAVSRSFEQWLMWPGTQHAIGFIISSGNVSLFWLFCIFDAMVRAWRALSLYRPQPSQQPSSPGGSMKKYQKMVRSMRCWQPSRRRSWAGAAGQKMNGNCPFFFMLATHSFFFIRDKTNAYTHVNMFHTDIRLLTTRQHVIIYFFFTISSLLCSF